MRLCRPSLLREHRNTSEPRAGVIKLRWSSPLEHTGLVEAGGARRHAPRPR